MTAAQQVLKGKLEQMLLLSSIAALPVAAATVFGCLMTIEIPPGSVPRLIISILITTGVMVGPVQVAYLRLTSTLKAVGSGKKPGTTPELQQIAREVLRLPDVVFWVNAGCWVGGPIISVVIFKLLVPALALRTMGLLVAVAALLAPVGAALGYVV